MTSAHKVSFSETSRYQCMQHQQLMNMRGRRFHPNEFPAKPLSRNSPALQLWEIWEIHTGLISDQVETPTKQINPKHRIWSTKVLIWVLHPNFSQYFYGFFGTFSNTELFLGQIKPNKTNGNLNKASWPNRGKTGSKCVNIFAAYEVEASVRYQVHKWWVFGLQQ